MENFYLTIFYLILVFSYINIKLYWLTKNNKLFLIHEINSYSVICEDNIRVTYVPV